MRDGSDYFDNSSLVVEFVPYVLMLPVLDGHINLTLLMLIELINFRLFSR